MRRENDIIEWLTNYAKDNNIDVEFVHNRPDYACQAIPEYQMVIINLNWKNQKEIPFAIGHELGHIICKHNVSNYYQSFNSTSKMEHEADLFSIKLLLCYAVNTNQTLTNPYQFINQFGIPTKMYEDTKMIFKKLIN
ncbi:ImmA/IrrE family metallo-endopeptidase [Lactobacillus acetotolerans]|uniref:ImmA/IrrE family metallo-endopeptidase n=1 Tax=Lactobacillus acetotolerans TaxID=1600 RepID=UPI0007B8597C|nr:ImmA/IrrE family metallo-endopeptidase [Lactobacillus acetotolerans]QGV03969.1 ImmA/IrrE family metallo-endopeptidase [Lactobacillus acetotolerans]